ncbi:TPA: hypothetical protein KEY88_005440 [Serratia marcescens]|nr:hypothetical protein [Serratia marcescens]
MKFSSIVGCCILGGSVVLAALINSKEIPFFYENIITTTNGHVNLGEVYSEKRLVDVTFTIDGFDSEPLVIKDISVDDFQSVINDKLKKLVDMANTDRDDKSKLTVSSMSAMAASHLTIRSHVNYTSEHMPMFDLTLKEKTMDFDKKARIQNTLLSNVGEFLASQSTAYKDAMFIKTM